MEDRLTREAQYYDQLMAGPSKTSHLLGKFSKAFYDKGPNGRVWSPVWSSINLVRSRVLDYGCGNGYFSCVLGQKGAIVTGIDISPESIREAAELSRKEGLSNEFRVCDAHQTSFNDNSFDFVFGNGVLHHLDLERAYAEVARVLKPNGTAFFMEPMYHHPLLWIVRRLTPKDHTADERPLSLSDIDKATKYFRRCTHQQHFLFAVLAAPLHVFGDGIASPVISTLDRLDQIIMSTVPPARSIAWLTMLQLEK